MRIQWLLELLQNYNTFAHEEDDYDEPRDRETIKKHQKYATRLFVILFAGK